MRFLLVTLLCVTLCTPIVHAETHQQEEQQQHQQEELENKKWSFTQALNDAKAELEGLKPTTPPKTPQQLAAEATIADRLHSMVAGIQREPAFESVIRQVNNANSQLFTNNNDNTKLFTNNNGKLSFNLNSPKLWMNQRQPRWKNKMKWNWRSPNPPVQQSASFNYFGKIVNNNKQSQPAAFNYAKFELNNNNKQSQPAPFNYAKVELNDIQPSATRPPPKPQAQASVVPTVPATTMMNVPAGLITKGNTARMRQQLIKQAETNPITFAKNFINGRNGNEKPATNPSATRPPPKSQAQAPVVPTVPATTMANGEVKNVALPTVPNGLITKGNTARMRQQLMKQVGTNPITFNGRNNNLKPTTNPVVSTPTIPSPLNPNVDYSIDNKGNLRPAPIAPVVSSAPINPQPEYIMDSKGNYYSVDNKGNLIPVVAPVGLGPINPADNFRISVGSTRDSQQQAPITITSSSIDTTIFEPEIDITDEDLMIRALNSIALETDAENEMNVAEEGERDSSSSSSETLGSKDTTTTTTTNTNAATDTTTSAATNTATNTATDAVTNTAANAVANTVTNTVTNTATNTATSTCQQGTSCPYDTRPPAPRSSSRSYITGYFKLELPNTQVQDVQQRPQLKSSSLRKLKMRIPGMSSSMEFINWLYDRVRKGGSRTQGLSRMELEQLTWWCDKHATPCPSCPNVMHDWIQPTLIESKHEGEGIVDSVGGVVNPMIVTLCPRQCVCPGVNGVPWYIRPAAIVPGLPPLHPVSTSLLETDTDTDTDVNAAATSETDTQAKAEVDTETTAQTESGADAEAQIETQAEAETETETETETQAEAETETEAAAETQTETEAGAEAEAQTETQTETEAAAEAQTETEAEAEAGAEAETEATAETEAQTETEAETESQIQTQAMSQAQVMEQMDATVEVGSEADWG